MEELAERRQTGCNERNPHLDHWAEKYEADDGYMILSDAMFNSIH